MKYRNVLNGQPKTWPFGTTKNVHVFSFSQALSKVLIVVSDEKEGFVLLKGAYPSDVKVGDTGTIEFMKGEPTEEGPTGGYWQFKKATKRK